MNIHIEINNYKGTGLYALDINSSAGYTARIIYHIYNPLSQYYSTELTGQGDIVITRSDNNVVSGTFEFVVQNEENANDKVTFTKGRFDLTVNGIK